MILIKWMWCLNETLDISSCVRLSVSHHIQTWCIQRRSVGLTFVLSPLGSLPRMQSAWELLGHRTEHPCGEAAGTRENTVRRGGGWGDTTFMNTQRWHIWSHKDTVKAFWHGDKMWHWAAEGTQWVCGGGRRTVDADFACTTEPVRAFRQTQSLLFSLDGLISEPFFRHWS